MWLLFVQYGSHLGAIFDRTPQSMLPVEKSNRLWNVLIWSAFGVGLALLLALAL